MDDVFETMDPEVEELLDAQEFVEELLCNDSDDGVDLREALDGCSLTLDEQEAIYGFTF